MKRTMIQTLFGNAIAFSGDPCAAIGSPIHASVNRSARVKVGVHAGDKQAP
jgi:hypothetical protein